MMISYDGESFADPHPTYARLRAQAPAVPLEDPNGLDYWLVTHYEEARLALAEPDLSRDPRHAWARLRGAGLVTGAAADVAISMLTADTPTYATTASISRQEGGRRLRNYIEELIARRTARSSPRIAVGKASQERVDLPVGWG